MKSDSFAEILKEKIEKSKITESNSRFSAQSLYTNTKESTAATFVEVNLDLSFFQTKLFQQSPQSFRNHFTGDVSQTPYNHYKSRIKQSQTKAKTSHSKEFQGDSATAGPNQKTQPQRARTAPQPAARMPREAHQLNSSQTEAMSYFINEKMFLLDDFTKEELKKAYKRLALLKHPDRQNGSSQHFIELQKNYEILNAVPKL